MSRRVRRRKAPWKWGALSLKQRKSSVPIYSWQYFHIFDWQAPYDRYTRILIHPPEGLFRHIVYVKRESNIQLGFVTFLWPDSSLLLRAHLALYKWPKISGKRVFRLRRKGSHPPGFWGPVGVLFRVIDGRSLCPNCDHENSRSFTVLHKPSITLGNIFAETLNANLFSFYNQ